MALGAQGESQLVEISQELMEVGSGLGGVGEGEVST